MSAPTGRYAAIAASVNLGKSARFQSCALTGGGGTATLVLRSISQGLTSMTTRILGIESSCDETAAAVVADGREILSTVVASQIDIHRKYGGVVPELASREHLRSIVPVVREALAQAGIALRDVDGFGVTCGPGLVGSLLVGLTYGKVLATSLGKP